MPASQPCGYIEAMPEQRMIGRTLAALRAAHGWSRAELAERSGVPEHRISRFERGEARPETPTLERLGEALQVRRSELRRWVDAVTAVLEGSSLHPPRLESIASVSWPFLDSLLSRQRGNPGEKRDLDEDRERCSDRAPGGAGDRPHEDPEVERLAREAADLAARFVRLSFRRLRDQDSD